MKLIKLNGMNGKHELKFKSEIPKDMENEIHSMFTKLNVVNYPFSNHEIVKAKINNEKWETLYPKSMYVKFKEVSNHTLKITGARLSTDNEIILGAFKYSYHFLFKVIL